MVFNKINSIFNRYINENYFSGGVCYISIDGKKVFHKAYGTSNRIENIPCNNNTIFDLASVTKIVTTTIILKMITENKLSLSTKLENCLPDVSTNHELAPITIKQLLTHSSGLKSWHSFYSHSQESNNIYNIFNNIEVRHKSENRVVYSDLNFILLGEVIKCYFDSSLQEIIHNDLARPLKLHTLTYNPKYKKGIAATEFGNKIEKKMCLDRNFHFTGWRDEKKPIVGEVNDGNTYYFFKGESGHAGLFANVKDIVSIGELYLKEGIFEGEEIISKELIAESLRRQVENRGLGWEASEIYPNGFGHTGFTGTAIWIEPKRKIAVGLLTNRLHVDNPQNINPFRREIFKEILKQIS
ncbi:serine hydrolase domain-containing protein [Virgibacillus ndiopensis]|uniref:serine hydrolase domain-containing protein n=1 Tax=Virgibacillus ndiopensis TaxID=2004408 RepID=UPI00159B8DD6|nr:serine hydrolase [Virgibacillus ndiopensis]